MLLLLYLLFFWLIFACHLFLKSFNFPLLFVLGVSLVSDYQWELCNSRWNSSSSHEWLEPIYIYCDWWCSWIYYLHVCILFICTYGWKPSSTLYSQGLPESRPQNSKCSANKCPLNKNFLDPLILIWFDTLWQNNSIVMALGLKFKLLVEEVLRRL